MMKTTKTFDITLLLVRVSLGLVIAAHGFQKLAGWFGGYGFDGTMGFLTDAIGLPYAIGILVILAESIGMIALVFGFLSRIMAASLVVVMAGAVITSHLQFGFFMNWFGNQGGEGFEFHILAVALAGVIVLNGAGAYALDALLKRKLAKSNAVTLLFN